MRALVTGVAGFIGSSIAAELLRSDENSVVGLDCLTDYYDPQLKVANLGTIGCDRFEFVQGDLNELPLEDILQDVDVVFHQAGQPGVRGSWGKQFVEYSAQNIEATQALLEAAKSAPALKRFVYASSSSVYGDAERYPTMESDRPAPRSPYGVTKLAAEHLCSLYAANFGVPTVSLRYFTVYGPRQRPDMAFNIFIQALLNGREIRIFGDGEQVREFTFVSDIVRANVLAATRPISPGTVINLSGGASVTVNQVLAVLEEIHGAPANVVHEAGFSGDVRRTGGDTTLATELLGWAPQVELRQGLLAEYEWLALMNGEQKADTPGLLALR